MLLLQKETFTIPRNCQVSFVTIAIYLFSNGYFVLLGMTLKPGDRVEGKTKHVKGKHGSIVREVEEGSKRKLFIIWDDESQGSFFTRAVKKIRTQNDDAPPKNAIFETNSANEQDERLGDDGEDPYLSESSTGSALSVDGTSDNEIGPEDGLVVPGVDQPIM